MFAIDNYISKLANIAKIDTKIERLALEIAQKTNNNFFSDGKAPNGLAAAYIYLASVLLGINLLQIDVSNFAGVTEVTIRNRCKDILNNFKLVVNAKPAELVNDENSTVKDYCLITTLCFSVFCTFQLVQIHLLCLVDFYQFVFYW